MKFNNVFVVDDDMVFHFIMKKLFSTCNVDVNTSYFFNGLEAIEEIKKKHDNESSVPDLILLDINMPILDGWQFLEEFKAIKGSLQKNVVVYLISSSNDISDINKAKEYQDEVKKYVLKPVTQEEFQKIFQ